MPAKNSYLTVTDQFCGAGGSSLGVRNIADKNSGGIQVKLALNHWKLAIETHNTNFPDTDHDCTDISAAEPRKYVSTDILITSPECTNHSLAKGHQRKWKEQLKLFGKVAISPEEDRSRATMWDVPRFAEFHNYNIIIVENVVDARYWVMFDAWLHAMHALGYKHRCLFLNSMHFPPTPQSRDRMYVVFWKKGNKEPQLNFTPLAYCPECSENIRAIQSWKKKDIHFGKYRRQYIYVCPMHGCQVEPYYYAAFNCIDWSNIGTRISDRKKTLSKNTIARIEYGLKKFGRQPLIINGKYTSGIECRVRPAINDRMDTIPGEHALTLCNPFIVESLHHGGINGRVKSVNDQLGTVTTQQGKGVCFPFIVNDQDSTGVKCRVKNSSDHLSTIRTTPRFKLISPFITYCEHSNNSKTATGINSTLRTQNTRQTPALVVPFLIELNRTGKARQVTKQLSTILSGGNHHALIVVNKGQSKTKTTTDPLSCCTTVDSHGLITTGSLQSFISYYYGNAQASYINEPVNTIPARSNSSLVSYSEPKIEDCYYRMLKSPEIQRGMAFPDEYIVLGNSRDKVKQLGNAVTPPVMQWIVERCIESLT